MFIDLSLGLVSLLLSKNSIKTGVLYLTGVGEILSLDSFLCVAIWLCLDMRHYDKSIEIHFMISSVNIYFMIFHGSS